MDKHWFILIAAVDKNFVIGKEGKLPWHNPDELRHFRRRIQNHDVVMGRKTAESLPGPQGKGVQYVLTRDTNFHREGFVNISSIEELKELAPKNKPLYVLGGQSTYEQFLDAAELEDTIASIELSQFSFEVEGGDAFFPREKMLTLGYRPIDRLNINGNPGWSRVILSKN